MLYPAIDLEPQRKFIEEKYRAGWSAKKIAEYLNLTRTVIYRRLRWWNIPRRFPIAHTIVCRRCGKTFKCKPHHEKLGRKFCSRKCADLERIGKKPMGAPDWRREKNPRWRGGKIIRLEKSGTQKTVYIHMPEHPQANREGYVAEHRRIAEHALGRYLKPGEIVHHANGKHDDNRNQNLVICDHGFHLWLHRNNKILKSSEMAIVGGGT